MPRVRWAIGIVFIAAVSAGCASTGPSVSLSTSTTAAPTSETTSVTPTDITATWEPKLREARGVLQPCRGDPYGQQCADGMKRLENLASELASGVDGSTFTELRTTANEVAEKAQRWRTECRYSEVGSALRSSCTTDTASLIYGGGVEQLQAQLYAATQAG